MTSIEQYVDTTIKFANSIVIKSIDTALAINKGLVLQGIPVPKDKKQWKYYLNISGNKHITNSDVKITVIELGQKVSLTRELLEQYRYTRTELLSGGVYYEELANEYPNDIAYIHGCMYPCDIDKAINSKDGTILSYNVNYVEPQEYQLLAELEKYIINFLARWNVSEYSLVDELYIPGMLSILYASLPGKIMNIRANNILTNQTHSFHLEHFFRSRMNIWDEVAILKKNTVYWLYKNLDYIIRNIGRQETFDIVLNKILTANTIGIGEYTLRLPNAELVKNPSIKDPSFEAVEFKASSEPLNSFYTSDGESVIDIDTLVNREIQATEGKSNNNNSNNVNRDKNNALISQVKKVMSKSREDKQKTKLLEITSYRLFKRNGIDLFKFSIDYLIYSYLNGNLSYLEEYVEPNNNKTWLCDPKMAILLILKVVLKMVGSEGLKIRRIYYDTVLFPDVKVIDIATKSLFPDGYTERLFKDMKDNYPSISRRCYSAMEFKDLLVDISNYYNYLWTIDANSESGYVSANLKMLYNLITDKGYIELTDVEEGETIDAILAKNNIEYTIEEGYDIHASYQAMMSTFTGMAMDEYKEIRATSEGFRSLVNKLTSYTLQTFMADTGEDTTIVRYNNTGAMRAFRGIITLHDGEFIPIEHNKITIEGEAKMFKDNPIVIPGSNININAVISKDNQVNLNGYIEPDKDRYWLSPTVYGEIYDYNRYILTSQP